MKEKHYLRKIYSNGVWTIAIVPLTDEEFIAVRKFCSIPDDRGEWNAQLTIDGPYNTYHQAWSRMIELTSNNN